MRTCRDLENTTRLARDIVDEIAHETCKGRPRRDHLMGYWVDGFWHVVAKCAGEFLREAVHDREDC